MASTAASLGASLDSSINLTVCLQGQPGALAELARDIQPSACHAASTASLAFRRDAGGAAEKPVSPLMISWQASG